MLLSKGRLRINRRNINHYYEIYHLLIRNIPPINTRYILYCHEIFDDKSTWIVAGSVIVSCANVASTFGGTDWKYSARAIVKNWGGHYSSDRFPVWTNPPVRQTLPTGEFETRSAATKPAGSEQGVRAPGQGCSDQSLARATKNWTNVIRESIGWTPVNPSLSAMNKKGSDLWGLGRATRNS